MNVEEVVKKLHDQEIPWDDVREQRNLARINESIGHRSAGRSRWFITATVAAAAAAALVFGVSLVDLDSDTEGTSSSLADTTQAQSELVDHSSTLDLADAGRAVLMPGAEVSVETRSDSLIEMVQTQGKVRYELEKAPGRKMAVRAAGVEIKVVGTIFSVELHEDVVRVQVERGIVAVDDGAQEVRLGAGEEIAVSAVEEKESPVELAAAEEVNQPEEKKAQATETPKVKKAQKSHAGIQELLTQSDAARRSGDLSLAAELLRRIVKEFPGDTRVVSALFTLGNVERNRGRHMKAAEAYRKCWRSSTTGPLAEDARAQEASSLYMAGKRDQSIQAATSYLQLYPSGTHAARMQRIAQP